MLYIKPNNEENTISKPVDVATMESLANDIQMDCYISLFDINHIITESYLAVLEDDQSDDNNDADTSDDANDSSKDEKGKLAKIKDKVVGFIKGIWEKLKNMFNRFLYWITTKITSNDKFIKEYEGKTLGKVKVKYDYDQSFDHIINSYEGYKVYGEAVDKLFKESRQIKSNGGDIIGDIASDIYAGIGLLQISEKSKIDDPRKLIKTQLMIELDNEHEVDGSALLTTLKTNAPTVDGFKKYSAGIMNFFRSLELKLKNPDGSRTLKINVNPLYKLMSLCSYNVTTCIVSAQKLILSIRSDIKKSAAK